MDKPEINTKRLTVGVLRKTDAEAMYLYRSDPDVCLYQGWVPGTKEEVVKFIASLSDVHFNTPGTWYQLAIRLQGKDVLVGDIGIHFMEDQPRQAELGITISPACQGSGFATEALTSAMSYLFKELDKHRIFASVDPRNKASIALLEKIGMRQEAHFRKSLWFKGEWVDDVIYAMLKSEWEKH